MCEISSMNTITFGQLCIHFLFPYFRHNTNYQQKWKGGSGLVGNIIMYVIIGLIIYGLYKTCWVSSPQPGADGHYRQPGDDPYRARPSAPPPPGFRQDYMPNRKSQLSLVNILKLWAECIQGSTLTVNCWPQASKNSPKRLVNV